MRDESSAYILGVSEIRIGDAFAIEIEIQRHPETAKRGLAISVNPARGPSFNGNMTETCVRQENLWYTFP